MEGDPDGEAMTAIPQHSSATNEHPTPEFIVTKARNLLGGFDLDPASTPEFNERIGAGRIFTQADDGLEHEWNGRVWLNPPGGKLRRVNGRWKYIGPKEGPGESSMRVWWNKLATEYEQGTVHSAFFVGFTLEIMRTSQNCVRPVQAFPRVYPKERLPFKGDQPTHANVLVYLPPRDLIEPASWLRANFGDVGLCEGGSR